jgi:hypothetical protein
MTIKKSVNILNVMTVIAVSHCACGNGNSEVGIGDQILKQELIVSDSIGSITDSLQMLGVVASSVHHPDGGLIILDRILNNLRLFLPDGRVLVLASEGSGPGFIQRAAEMTIAGNQILIVDKGKRCISRYSLTGQYLNADTETGIFEPYGIFGLVNGDFVSTIVGSQMSETDEIELFIRIGQYNDSLEGSTEYFYQTWSPPYNGIYSVISQIRYCTSPYGPVYFCPDPSDYRVLIFDSDAQVITEITRYDIERVHRSAEEIEAIKQRQQEQFGNQYLFQGRNDPNPYETIIQLAGVDSLNRLWIWKLNDVSDGYIRFDIWTDQGELVEQAEIEWSENREPVSPWVDSGGVLLRTTDEASEVKIYEIVYSQQ